MKLLTYIYHGREDFGVLCKNGEFLCSAGAVCQGSYRSLAELIAALSTEDRQRLEAAAAADPPSLGLPAVGPLPSMAVTPSIKARLGL